MYVFSQSFEYNILLVSVFAGEVGFQTICHSFVVNFSFLSLIVLKIMFFTMFCSISTMDQGWINYIYPFYQSVCSFNLKTKIIIQFRKNILGIFNLDKLFHLLFSHISYGWVISILSMIFNFSFSFLMYHSMLHSRWTPQYIFLFNISFFVFSLKIIMLYEILFLY